MQNFFFSDNNWYRKKFKAEGRKSHKTEKQRTVKKVACLTLELLFFWTTFQTYTGKLSKV